MCHLFQESEIAKRKVSADRSADDAAEALWTEIVSTKVNGFCSDDTQITNIWEAKSLKRHSWEIQKTPQSWVLERSLKFLQLTKRTDDENNSWVSNEYVENETIITGINSLCSKRLNWHHGESHDEN